MHSSDISMHASTISSRIGAPPLPKSEPLTSADVSLTQDGRISATPPAETAIGIEIVLAAVRHGTPQFSRPQRGKAARTSFPSGNSDCLDGCRYGGEFLECAFLTERILDKVVIAFLPDNENPVWNRFPQQNFRNDGIP